VISAFFFSKEVWAFVSGVLLYIIFGIVILSTFLYKYIKNKFIMKKYKDDEWFDIVDNEGKIIGKAPRTICHNGCKLLHPVVHIHIFNTHHKLLLQKRSKHKDIQPGLWDTSVGGHISSGEKLEVALRREANEELGINIAIEKLIPLSKYIFESDIEKELVFSFVYITDDKVYFQISEIDEVKFYSKKEIQSLVENGQTTKNFKLEFDLLNKPEFKKIIPF
ncbi:MAG TPA: NUDIX domain-containing protein, partial [Spirochaetota bacterium]|nr:NUDIX domain-containing protein [Spirochaetota bacterium]